MSIGSVNDNKAIFSSVDNHTEVNRTQTDAASKATMSMCFAAV